MRIFYMRIAILLILIVTGCSRFDSTQRNPEPTVQERYRDTTIITRDPCHPPCWYMIKPGISTKDEANQILSSLPFLDSSTIRERETVYWDPVIGGDKDGVLLAVDYLKPEGQQASGFLIVDGVIMDFTIYPNYSLTFQDVIESIGPPDYIRVFSQTGMFQGCNTQLLWLNIGVKINNTNQNIKDCAYQKKIYYVDSVDYMHNGWLKVWPLESDIPWTERSK